MRVPATTATGPVADLTQDQIDAEFSHIIRTNFSGQVNWLQVTQQPLHEASGHAAVSVERLALGGLGGASPSDEGESAMPEGQGRCQGPRTR